MVSAGLYKDGSSSAIVSEGNLACESHKQCRMHECPSPRSALRAVLPLCWSGAAESMRGWCNPRASATSPLRSILAASIPSSGTWRMQKRQPT